MLHATGRGAPIRYTTDVCYECKQPFERSLDTRYRRTVTTDGKTHEAFFCTHKCVRQFDTKQGNDRNPIDHALDKYAYYDDLVDALPGGSKEQKQAMKQRAVWAKFIYNPKEE